MFKFYFLSILLLATIPYGLAINCFVCNATDSSNPFQCGEWFDRFDVPDLIPQDCSGVHGAKYCVKHIGRFEGGIGAKRYCSSKDLGNYCDYVKNKGDLMEYRSCLYTCNTDGCNSTTSIKGSILLLFVCLINVLKYKLNSI